MVGVGNILMGDEGVGIEVVNILEKKSYTGDIELIDAGTSFFNIVSDLRSFEKVIIIDAVNGGREAGTVYRFKPGDIEEAGSPVTISLHDFGVLESIKLERVLGKFPDEVVFFGIEPYKIELSMELSPQIKEKMNYIIAKVLDELKKEGIETVS
ncbi:MAG: hydrogenase maturation protease [Spirochaetes bacterium]|nr:hydrogenase maturation protease [Spirochaetota bacterium]